MRLIDADAFIKENQEIIDCEIDHPKYQDTLRELIAQAPTVERPHGEWVNYVDDFGNHVVMCTRCCITNEYDSGYCPHCGAKMQANERQVTGKLNSEICPCIDCCKLDNSELCRKGCSDYQKWKEGGAE